MPLPTSAGSVRGRSRLSGRYVDSAVLRGIADGYSLRPEQQVAASTTSVPKSRMCTAQVRFCERRPVQAGRLLDPHALEVAL